MDDFRHRRSTRLSGYDYSSAGAYFVTICAHRREHVFGSITNGEMELNDVGKIVENEWRGVPSRYPGIQIDEFALMPNHFHGIVWIVDGVGAPLAGAHSDGAGARPAPTLGYIIGGFKSITTVRYIRMSPSNPWKLWQRNYYERIIRDGGELDRIRQYIRDNPTDWELDPENKP